MTSSLRLSGRIGCFFVHVRQMYERIPICVVFKASDILQCIALIFVKSHWKYLKKPSVFDLFMSFSLLLLSLILRYPLIAFHQGWLRCPVDGYCLNFTRNMLCS